MAEVQPKPVVCSYVFYAFLTLKYKTVQRLRVFENRVLRRIFGPKRNEATGD
jgi:hypothetical protein